MESKNLAIISLILGIASIVLAFPLCWLGLILAIVGIVLGSKANKIEKTGMGTAGFVLSIIGLILSILVLLIVVVFASCLIGGAFGALGGLSDLAGSF